MRVAAGAIQHRVNDIIRREIAKANEKLVVKDEPVALSVSK
jgi:hypothetical protein